MPRSAINHQDDILNFSTKVEEVPKIRVFAYRADIGGENSSIFEANAHTVCYLKQELNEYYAEIESYSEDMQLLNTENKMRDGMMRLSTLASFKLIFPEDITITLNNKNIFFTLNQPLNIDSFNEWNQPVYYYSGKYSDNFVFPGQERNYKNVKQGQKIEKMKNKQNRTTFELQDIRTLESMQNSAIHFTFTERWSDVTSFKLRFDSSCMPQKIYGKELRPLFPPRYSEANFKIDGLDDGVKKIGLVKVVPISTKGKLTLFIETNDYQANLPWAVANAYVLPKSLRPEIVRNDEVWEKDLWQTFLSILELTNAFSTGFANYTIADKTSIDPNAQIGGINISLLPSINYADAKEVIDGRIEAYTQKWPKRIDTLQFRLFKTFLNMLTPYVKCKYALGGGLNHANKIDSLFYFDLRTSIVKDLAKTDATEIEVQLKSSYFDFNEVTKEMTLKDQFLNVSNYKIINTNGWVSFAELPDEATALPRPAIQGDKEANDEDITKFFCYVFFENQEKMEEFYGSSYSFDKNAPKTKEISRNKTNEEYFEYIKVLAHKDGPDLTKYTKQYIADTFIKPSLSANQTLKILGGEYDISNISAQITSRKLLPYPPHGILGNDEWETATVTITYDFTIIQTGDIFDLPLNGENTIIDKLGAFSLNTYNNGNYIYNTLNLTITKDDKPWKVDALSQITIEGFYGDFLELIQVKNGETLSLGRMNFAGKYNEKKLSTKINL